MYLIGPQVRLKFFLVSFVRLVVHLRFPLTRMFHMVNGIFGDTRVGFTTTRGTFGRSVTTGLKFGMVSGHNVLGVILVFTRVGKGRQVTLEYKVVGVGFVAHTRKFYFVNGLRGVRPGVVHVKTRQGSFFFVGRPFVGQVEQVGDTHTTYWGSLMEQHGRFFHVLRGPVVMTRGETLFPAYRGGVTTRTKGTVKITSVEVGGHFCRVQQVARVVIRHCGRVLKLLLRGVVVLFVQTRVLKTPVCTGGSFDCSFSGVLERLHLSTKGLALNGVWGSVVHERHLHNSVVGRTRGVQCTFKVDYRKGNSFS